MNVFSCRPKYSTHRLHADEYVVFVTPSSLQRKMFTQILQPDTLNSLLRDSVARSLAMIQLLTKISNSPVLLRATLERGANNSGDDAQVSLNEAMKLLPSTARNTDVELSGKPTCMSLDKLALTDFPGKLKALFNLLAHLRRVSSKYLQLFHWG